MLDRQIGQPLASSTSQSRQATVYEKRHGLRKYGWAPSFRKQLAQNEGPTTVPNGLLKESHQLYKKVRRLLRGFSLTNIA
ncbi:hypothetical protein GCM10027423_42580 [Spirosoma arcticum]